jgi:hypothetical protein
VRSVRSIPDKNRNAAEQSNSQMAGSSAAIYRLTTKQPRMFWIAQRVPLPVLRISCSGPRRFFLFFVLFTSSFFCATARAPEWNRRLCSAVGALHDGPKDHIPSVVRIGARASTSKEAEKDAGVGGSSMAVSGRVAISSLRVSAEPSTPAAAP